MFKVWEIEKFKSQCAKLGSFLMERPRWVFKGFGSALAKKKKKSVRNSKN